METETKKILNELVQEISKSAIKGYSNDQPLDVDEIRALADLVSAINNPAFQYGPESIVGFALPTTEDHEE